MQAHHLIQVVLGPSVSLLGAARQQRIGLWIRCRAGEFGCGSDRARAMAQRDRPQEGYRVLWRQQSERAGGA